MLPSLCLSELPCEWWYIEFHGHHNFNGTKIVIFIQIIRCFKIIFSWNWITLKVWFRKEDLRKNVWERISGKFRHSVRDLVWVTQWHNTLDPVVALSGLCRASCKYVYSQSFHLYLISENFIFHMHIPMYFCTVSIIWSSWIRH